MVLENAATAKGGMKTGALLAACVGVLALPSAVMGFSATLSFQNADANPIDALHPEVSPENLLRVIATRSLAKGQPFPFTPAGTPARGDRSVTVAVRVDTEAAKAIIVRSQPQVAQNAAEAGRLRIAPTAFNLGMSRGYQNFAPEIPAQPPARSLAEIPEVQKFSLQPGAGPADQSRFSTRLSIDEKRAPGRAPRTFAGEAGEVDLRGAYRVTDNLNVTAGVRYSQERERLLPLTDGRQDSQAVYVGTQFRF